MTQYRKKPVVIDAFRWTGDRDQTEEPDWIVEAIKAFRVRFAGVGGHNLRMEIDMHEGGQNIAEPGDWIIRGVRGEIYPCKPDIFEETYQPASEGGELPPGERQDVVTYCVRDRNKALRRRACTSRDHAKGVAESLAENSCGEAPYTVHEVRYVSFRHESEALATFGGDDEKPE